MALASTKKVFMLGMGDVGVRLAQMVAESGLARELRLAGRGENAAQWARLFALGTRTRTSSVAVDGRDPASLARALAEFEPDLIVQCATLLAPFSWMERGTPRALAVPKAGFATQVAAHLPIVAALMRARREAGIACPVINCSIPDIVNPMLAAAGLAPAAGVGNAAIIACLLEAALPKPRHERLKVVAHHAQLLGFIVGDLPRPGIPLPLVYLDGERVKDDGVKIQSGLKLGKSLNYLTALTAMPLIEGLLDPARTLETHACGVLGLSGGYPIRIHGGQIELDLPSGLSREAAVEFNRSSGQGDAVERIESDGTLIYTEAAKAVMAPLCPELTEPLAPEDGLKRFAVLEKYFQSCKA